VVSLPQETFYSSGASVKASLLFLQKFSEKEKARFDKHKQRALNDSQTKYQAEIADETARLNSEIADAKAAKDAERRKDLQKQLKAYERQMGTKIAAEARALLKQRFDYPVFLYEAEKVGITATGEQDENELYPNPRVPQDLQKTALDRYRDFLRNPKPFFV